MRFASPSQSLRYVATADGRFGWFVPIPVMTDPLSNHAETLFYLNQTIENGWSRDVLALQIKSNLYARQGKAISNFKQTLPSPQSDLARQTLKDPYTFDFLTMTSPYNERDIENQLVEHITKFLLELGKGFAFVGRQYHLEVGETDYYLDLLFYHIKLKCYVVIELKNTKFIPEYAGKLNFYLSAVDSMLKSDADNPAIGILLCRHKNKIETEFALIHSQFFIDRDGGGMELKPGYKQTEVGMIPEDWQCVPVGEITEIRVGRDLRPEFYAPYCDSTYRYPVYSNTVAIWVLLVPRIRW